jgi:putative acetyltransferase
MRAAVRSVSSRLDSPRALAAWASLPPIYHRWAMGPGGETYLLAEQAGRAVGYAALRGDELTAVFVRPGLQGRGVGRALVDAAVRRARRGGHRRLRVIAASGAVGFYAALGFRAGARVRAPLPGGLSLAAVRMRLRLDG